MDMINIIQKKKRNLVLSKEEIEFVVNEYVNGKIPDYQMSALLMAVYFNGMNYQETTDLTLAMVNSGDVMDYQVLMELLLINIVLVVLVIKLL